MGKVNKFDGRSFEFYEDGRGFYYLKVKEGEDVVEQDVFHLNAWIEEEGSGERKPLLLELAYGSTISAEVQQYLSDNTYRYSTADAFLIQTFAHKLLTTFYLRHFKPKIPTRVFQDVFEALEWIKTQIEAAEESEDQS